MVIAFWILWVAGAYFASQLIVSVALSALPIDISTSNNTLLLMVVEASTYILMLLIGLAGTKLVKDKFKLPGVKKLLGCDRPVRFRDIINGFGGSAVYYMLLIAVMFPLMLVIPDIISQEQTIGFGRDGNSWWELALICIALVIVAPVAEELLMRGLLFGRIRDKLPFWPTALIISAIFAVAHWQINVTIDTFILSMVICYMREKTGTVYPGILMHIIKNGLAYVLLFLV